jgi:hypothetical protein
MSSEYQQISLVTCSIYSRLCASLPFETEIELERINEYCSTVNVPIRVQSVVQECCHYRRTDPLGLGNNSDNLEPIGLCKS